MWTAGDADMERESVCCRAVVGKLLGGFSHAAASTPLGLQDAQAAPVCRDFLKVRPVCCALPVFHAELGSI